MNRRDDPVEQFEAMAREAFDKKHNQLDLFVASIVEASPKSDRHSMEHPMFSLSKRPDRNIREYVNGDTTITITPSVLGMATIWDKDILIYCASQITEALNRKEEVSRKVKIDSYAILKATSRGTGGNSYDQIIKALDRLAGTRIKTDIKTSGIREVENFGFIDRWKVLDKHPKSGRAVSVEVEISEWLFRDLVGREIFTLNVDYFKLTKGLERRLYELARKHVGHQSNIWRIRLEKLHIKSGSSALLKKFRSDIKELVQLNNLPDYSMAYLPKTDMVEFSLKVLPVK